MKNQARRTETGINGRLCCLVAVEDWGSGLKIKNSAVKHEETKNSGHMIWNAESRLRDRSTPIKA
jgi:hypothetical protein